MDKQCEKNCIANLNGVCCLSRCKGQIIVLKKCNNFSAEKRCKMYKFLKETLGEDFECNESIFKDEEDWEESKMSDNLKFDDDKPRLDLVPPELIEAVGIVRTYGVSKYGDSESWKQVEPYRYRAALMRHICLYIKEPDGVDAESGLPHLWHIACNVAFLIALNAEKCPTSDFKAKTVNLSDEQ